MDRKCEMGTKYRVSDGGGRAWERISVSALFRQTGDRVSKGDLRDLRSQENSFNIFW